MVSDFSASARVVRRAQCRRNSLRRRSYEQAQDLLKDPKHWVEDFTAYEALQALREKTMPLDPNRYGNSPDDWKPFAHLPELAERTVLDLLYEYDRARREHVINSSGNQTWILVSHSTELTASDEAVRKRLVEVLKAKCLVILDPMSLLHKDVYYSIVTDW